MNVTTNTANIIRGAIYLESSTITINESWFSTNRANYGGTMYLQSSNVIIAGSQFSTYKANYGGTMY